MPSPTSHSDMYSTRHRIMSLCMTAVTKLDVLDHTRLSLMGLSWHVCVSSRGQRTDPCYPAYKSQCWDSDLSGSSWLMCPFQLCVILYAMYDVIKYKGWWPRYGFLVYNALINVNPQGPSYWPNEFWQRTCLTVTILIMLSFILTLLMQNNDISTILMILSETLVWLNKWHCMYHMKNE